MKRRILLSSIALCFAVLGAMAQRSYTFNAAALNVDGLPNQEIDAVVTTVNLNPGGKNQAGATEFCNYLANSNWDIVGLSEDFNFHSYVAGAPASDYYNFGTHGGTIKTQLSQAFDRAATDGLGIAVVKRFSFTPTGSNDTGAQVQWNTEYGGSGLTTVGDNGADNMIAKGFRMYTVTIATGVAVDVYVLHMDASTADSDDDYDSNGKDRNVIAREAQLKQLADYIIANHNNRPVIIIGDTNCRYTREQLKTGFIDYINDDSRLTINDPWVDLMWGGAYPEYGTGSLMTHTYGQKGEVVDKVFYINTNKSNLTLKANTYLWDESINVSDHKPVVVNFTLTDTKGTPLTDAEKEDNWTLEETAATFQKPSWQGEQVVSGTTYYVMNVGTGTYIKWGGWWNAQAITGNAGHPVTPTLNNGKYELVTVASEGRSIGHGLFMDNTDHNTWTLTPVDGTPNHYYIENGDVVLTINNDKNSGDYKKALTTVAKNTSDETQRWIFLTKEGMKTTMQQANADYPFNFTPLLGAADFDVYDDFGGYAKANWTNFEGNCAMNYVQWGAGPDKYNSSAAIVSTANAVTLSQALTNMPAGNYKMSYEGFYNYVLNDITKTTIKTRTRTQTRQKISSNWSPNDDNTGWSDYNTDSETINSSTTSEQTMTATVQFGSASATLPVNRNNGIGDIVNASVIFRDNDTYLNTLQQTLSSAGSLTVKVSKPATTASTSSDNTSTKTTNGTASPSIGYPKTRTQTQTTTIKTTAKEYLNSVHFDEFHLTYYGTGAAPQDSYADYKKMVLEKVNETYPKVMALNAAGQAAYDISVVIERYNKNQITNGQIAQAMCDYVDNSYANALAAHNAFIVQQAIDQMAQNGGDLTAIIANPSFEEGNLTGWTVGGGTDVSVQLNSNGTYTISNCEGSYLFNSWSGDDGHTSSVMQTIKGIPNGLYELKAVLASFGTADGKSHDYRVYLVGNGYHSSVAAVGGKTVGQETTLYFLVEDGTATIGAIGGNKGGGAEFIHYWPWEGCFFKADNFRLKYICDVPHGRLKLALNEAEAANLDAYGKAALNISEYQNKYNNKSLTGDGNAEVEAIYNALQTAAKAQKIAGADMTWAITNPNFETGDYTGWTCETGGDTKAASQENGTYSVAGTDGRFMFNTWDNGTAKSVTQTVSGLTNGTYKLTAMVATDAEKSIILTGNGVSTTIAASTNGNSSGVFPEVECKVTNGTLAITVAGVDDVWYKCDNFRLTLVKPAELRLSETATMIADIENVTYPNVILERTIKGQDSNGNVAWASFVAPFDIEAFEGWDYKELTGATYNESAESLVLTFSTATSIKAGQPYMIRCNTLGTGKHTELDLGERTVNTVTMNNTEIDVTNGNGAKVIFKGVYTKQFVPEGAFFISNNTFYRSADSNSNTLKGFRAYIEVEGDLASKARSMSFRWDDEDTTGVEAATEEVTTVAIYDINGVRLSEMQQGINILLMSDGSVVKIMVK